MDYILAGLFIVVLIFEYFQTKQFMGAIKHLVHVISELKSFALGMPEEEEGEPRARALSPPGHPDFGLGKILDEVDKAESKDEEVEI